MPDVILIAGPNGAGKSTLAPALLRDGFGIVEYVNADTIAEGLSAFSPETAAIEAAPALWQFIAASNDFLEEIAMGDKIEGEIIVDATLWRKSLK